VVIALDPLELKVDKFCGVKRASLLEFHCLHSGSRPVEVRVDTQTSCSSTDQVEPHVRAFGRSRGSGVTTCRGKQLMRIPGQHKFAFQSIPIPPTAKTKTSTLSRFVTGTEESGGLDAAD